MTIAKVLSIVMLVSLTFGAGLQVDREHLKSVFSEVGLLTRALLANVVIVPLVGVIVTTALRLNPYIATGILLMAISPGVPFVLSGARKKGGRLSFAVALAFLLPVVSIVTVPITARLVLPVQAASELPLAHFVTVLFLFQLLPLLAGMAVTAALRRRIPALERACQLLFMLSVIALVIVLAPRIAHSVSVIFGSLGIIAIVLIDGSCIVAGWFLGGPQSDDRRILALATTLRNIGLVASIATTSFREPEIVAAALTYFVVQVAASVAMTVLFTRSAQRKALA
ncbi:MAG: hypothetical protein JO322_14605 [Candidatus Eremiobacteraeota bacterium]|nr:hypothetical protein [Candidatus Eremiobacteraeota bacterium]